MGELLAAEIGVARIAMGVDVDHAEGPFGAERAQDRIRYDVVAADRERRHAPMRKTARSSPRSADSVSATSIGLTGTSPRSAQAAERIGRDMRAVVDEPHQRRRLADLARAEAGAGPVRRRAVEGNAEKRDVDLARRLRGIEDAAGA